MQGAWTALVAIARRAWPHVVAAFVLYHLVANSVDMVPNPSHGMDRRAWRDPRVAAELRTWAGVFGVPPAEFEDRLYAVGIRYASARKMLMVPFDPYFKKTGLRQYWSMFVAGSRYAERFEVSARACRVAEPCAWDVLFLQGDPAHAWHEAQLQFSRVRSATFRWGWPQSRKSYERGCRALAARAFAEEGARVVVRCAFVRGISPSPREPSPPPPERGREVIVTRADLPASSAGAAR